MKKRIRKTSLIHTKRKRKCGYEYAEGKTGASVYRGSFYYQHGKYCWKKEGEGPLAGHFDVIGEDDKFGQNTWEEAESTPQKEAFTMAVGRAGLKKEDIRYLFAGDLWGRPWRPRLGCWIFRYRSLDFTEPAVPVGNRCLSVRCV